MKNLIFLIALFTSFFAGAQNVQTRTNGTTTPLDTYLFTGKGFKLPVFTDTTTANAQGGLDSAGKMIYTADSKDIWYRQANPKKWRRLVDTTLVPSYYYVDSSVTTIVNNFDTTINNLYTYVDSSLYVYITNVDSSITNLYTYIDSSINVTEVYVDSSIANYNTYIQNTFLDSIYNVINYYGLDSGTRVISGTVLVDSGFVIQNTRMVWKILGQIDTASAGSLTIPGADDDEPKYVIIVGDTLGNIYYKEGEPGIINAIPEVLSASEILLAVYYIEAGATTPINVTTEWIYRENTEWITTSNVTGFNATWPSNPWYGVNIFLGTPQTGRYVDFTDGQLHVPGDYTFLTWQHRMTADVPRRFKIAVSFLNGNSVIHTNTVTVEDGKYGFDRTNSGVWFPIAIPITDFQFLGAQQFDKVRFVFLETPGTSMQIDDARLQRSGGSVPSGEQWVKSVNGQEGLHINFDVGTQLQYNEDTSLLRLIDTRTTKVLSIVPSLLSYIISTDTCIIIDTIDYRTFGISMNQYCRGGGGSVLDIVAGYNVYFTTDIDGNTVINAHDSDAIRFVEPVGLDSNMYKFSATNGREIVIEYLDEGEEFGSSYTLPLATPTILGGIKIGDNLFMNADSTLDAIGIQSIVGGSNVSIDDTDPENPIINVTLDGGNIIEDLEATTLVGNTANRDIFLQSVRVGRGPAGLTTNTVVGQGAMAAITTGTYNTAMGNGALALATTTTNNTAIGERALTTVVTNSGYNTAVGSSALEKMTTGTGLNTALGSYSQWSTTTGYGNTSAGGSSLQSNTTGFWNTAIGASAMRLNTTGEANTSLGISSMDRNVSGIYNTALGTHALFKNQTGSYNVVGGSKAMYESNAATSNNSVFGYGAMYGQSGSSNAVLGYQAMYYNVSGGGTSDNNAVVGYTSGYDLSTGDNNTFVGYNTGRGITTGAYNTVIGGQVTGLSAALTNNVILADGQGNKRLWVNSAGKWTAGTYGVGTHTGTATYTLQVDASGNVIEGAVGGGGGSNWTIIGSDLYRNSKITVNSNIAPNEAIVVSGNIKIKGTADSALISTFVPVGSIGQSIYIGNGGQSATGTSADGSFNTALGWKTLFALTTGSSNVAIGRIALQALTIGTTNVAVGANSGYRVTTGSENSLLGYGSGNAITTGQYNTAVGYNALNAVTSANDNTAVGHRALFANSAASNTAVGYSASYFNSTGVGNTSTGWSAGFSNATGNYNTSMGYEALKNNATSNNTSMGYQAGSQVTSGSNNTFFGYQAGITVNSGSGNTIIGAGIGGSASLANTVIIGSSAAERVRFTSAGVMRFATVPTDYADNTAALAGGLVAGDVYRTGDTLKIVH